MHRKKWSIRWDTMKILVFGFLGVIFLGGFLLWLPVCNRQPIAFMDALFTSVTAVCVTGLVTITPAVQFTLYNETVDNIKDRLDKGLVDIGLLLEPIDVTKYDYVRLDRQDTWGLLVRDDHPLAKKASLTAEDAASCPLLLPLRESIRAEILHWLGG